MKAGSSLLPVEQANPPTGDTVTNGNTPADHDAEGEDGSGGMSKMGGELKPVRVAQGCI